MLTIRLSRVGRKNDPSFRVIVVESKRKPQPGNYLEMVGSYNPKTDRIELNGERIKHWISNGATVSDTVHNLLVTKKIIDEKKKNVLPKKTVAKKEEPAVEAPAEKNESAPDASVGTPTSDVGAVDTQVAAETPEA